MLGSGMNLITTVIGFGMSTTFIVFVCARLLCARIRSADSRAAAANGAPTAYDLELQSEPDQQPEHLFDGLEPVVVASLPSMKYEKEAFRPGEDAQCSICLGDYQEKEILRIMPNCGHVFHLSCIDAWLQKQSTCPICRLSLHDQIEAKYVASPFPRAVRTLERPQVAGDHPNRLSRPNHERGNLNQNNVEIYETVHVNLAVSSIESENRR